MTRRNVALSALSGLLLAASFPPINLSLLAWFALVPFLIALRDMTPTEAFLAGMTAGIVFFSGTLFWITHSVNVYGHLALFPASLITLLLCAYCALYPALFGVAIAPFARFRPSLVLIAAPAAWTALELARTYVFSGFPWALLGYSQYRYLPLIQVADVTGVYGISFLIVLMNTALTAVIEGRKRMFPLVVTAVMLTAVLVYGQVRLNETSGAESIKIAVVQGNIEQDKKWDPVYQAEVIARYKRLTLNALEAKPDLVIWPETATPFYFGGSGENAVMTDDLRRFVRTTGTALLTGSPTFERANRRDMLRNSAFFLDGDGAVGDIYTKHHLVPFGEYVPLKNSVLFFVDKLVRASGDFQAGREYTVVGVRSVAANRNVPVSTVICYEIIFPDLVRRFVNNGATVLTNVTNDAWFGRTGAPYQHFSMAVFRAVENRVPVARAANTGISGFIDANGRILDASDIFTEAHLTRTLVPGGTKTFYTHYGDVFAYLCSLAGLVLLALPRRNNHNHAQTRAQRAP